MTKEEKKLELLRLSAVILAGFKDNYEVLYEGGDEKETMLDRAESAVEYAKWLIEVVKQAD